MNAVDYIIYLKKLIGQIEMLYTTYELWNISLAQ